MYIASIETLVDLERRLDTSAFTYGGICYWPICRHYLWDTITRRLVLSKGGAGSAVPNTGPKFQMPESRPDVFPVIRPELGLLHHDKATAAKVLAGGGGTPRILFSVRPEEYFDTVDGGRYAKTVDSVLENALGRYPLLKVELFNFATIGFPRTYPSLFLDFGIAGLGLEYDPPHELKNFDVLAAALAGTDLTIDADALRADLGRVFYFARIFEALLLRLRPSVFIQSVYYYPVGMAWVLACRRAGVTSVDLQHGRLGPQSGHYTHLTAAPPRGYDLVPDLVWCWGEQTRRDIEAQKNPACPRHGGIVGGNPWLARWRYGADPLSADRRAALDSLCRDRDVILVSLQPLDTPLRREIIEAMRQSPPAWLWLLRLHPLRRHTAPAIRDLLAANGITNFELDLATEMPLFSLLQRAHHHVTVFSSVVVEAAAFDVPSSVTGDEGLEVFGPQLASGVCRYTPTAGQILTHIVDSLTPGRPALQDDFIAMSPTLAVETLTALAGPSIAAGATAAAG